MAQDPIINIYTDGSCNIRTGHGGWAAILFFTDKNNNIYEKHISGYCKNTTNNRAEILATLYALQLLKKPCRIMLASDSQYIVNSIGHHDNLKSTTNEGWIIKWHENGWKKKKGILSNIDLWKMMHDELMRHISVKARWVRGHDNNYYNEKCDVLANKARRVLEKSDKLDKSITDNIHLNCKWFKTTNDNISKG